MEYLSVVGFISIYILILIALINFIGIFKLTKKSKRKRNLILVIFCVIIFSGIASILVLKMEDPYMFFFITKIYFPTLLIFVMIVWFLKVLIKNKRLFELQDGPTKKYEKRTNIIVTSFLSLIFLSVIPHSIIRPVKDLQYISKGIFLKTTCITLSQSIGSSRGGMFNRSVNVKDLKTNDTIHLQFDSRNDILYGQIFTIKYLPNTRIGIVIEEYER